MKYIKAPIYIDKDYKSLPFELKFRANRLLDVSLLLNRAIVIYTNEFNISPNIINGNYKLTEY